MGLLGSIFAKKIYKNNNKHVNKERLKGFHSISHCITNTISLDLHGTPNVWKSNPNNTWNLIIDFYWCPNAPISDQKGGRKDKKQARVELNEGSITLTGEQIREHAR